MEEKNAAGETVVRKIKEYIESHQKDELSLDKIAAALNYSKFYMGRVFAKATGTTICKYIQGRRLDAAAEQLVTTNRPVIDIALETGYGSPQAFTLAFRRFYRCSPRAYRKNRISVPGKSEMMGGRLAA